MALIKIRQKKNFYNMLKFSVLMTVYKTENPAFLDRAIKSIWDDQELKPNQIVIIKDGPVKESLNKVLENWKNKLIDIIEIHSLKENVGLGNALKFGINYCKYEFIARMDTDDISLPKRFKDQIDFLSTNEDVDIIGSFAFECEGNEHNITGIRKVPISNLEIYRVSKFRNPFNHPSIIYRKKKVVEAGGPKKFTDFDDYYLWIRMFNKKAFCANLNYPLIIMRAGSSQALRRGGVSYVANETKFFYFLYKISHISMVLFIVNIIIRVPIRLLPHKLRHRLYQLLRKK